MWGSGHPNSPPRQIRQACAQRADPWMWVDEGHLVAGETIHTVYVISKTDLAFRCCVLCAVSRQIATYSIPKRGVNSMNPNAQVQPPSVRAPVVRFQPI